MPFAMDKSAKDSLYQQLYRSIEAQIIGGTLRPGDKLPSYRWTAKKYGINVSTVTRAYQMLEEAGVVRVVQGSGSYVKALNSQHFFADKVVLENFGEGQLLERPLVNFSSATPYLDTYPVRDFQELLTDLIGEGLGPCFAYHGVQGDLELRRALCDYFATQGVDAAPDRVQILSGSQQGIDLLCKALLDAHATLVTGNPSYTVAVNTFQSAGAEVVSVPTGEGGLDLEALERLLSKKRVHFVYCMPNFQSPTGACMGPAEQQRLLELAQEQDFYIVEDDCHAEIYFDGRPHSPLKALDRRDRVIYLKSFSKILMPGLRMGCMILPEQFVERVVAAKFYSDISSPPLQQRLLARFLQEGRMGPYLEGLRTHYAARHRAMLEAVEGCRHLWIPHPPAGGLTVWARLPGTVDCYRFYRHMKEHHGILFLPGNLFSHDGTHSEYIRLSFAVPSLEEIRDGVALMDRVLEEHSF